MSVVVHVGAHLRQHRSRMLRLEDWLSGKEERVMIARRGKPAVLVTPVKEADTSRRIGLAQGRFEVADDIDTTNPAIEALFTEGRE